MGGSNDSLDYRFGVLAATAYAHASTDVIRLAVQSMDVCKKPVQRDGSEDFNMIICLHIQVTCNVIWGFGRIRFIQKFPFFCGKRINNSFFNTDAYKRV